MTDQLGFSVDSEVNVHQISDEDWETLSALEYFTGTRRLRVDSGQETDFASVPRLFVWLMPRYGPYTKAAILHDHLCRTGIVPRREADTIFRQAMRELDVAFLRRWLMWAAVRIGALRTRDGRRGWLRSACQVFLLFLVAVPVILPPAVTIVVGLALFYAFERVTQGILALANVLRRKRGKAEKRVNRPRLSFKL